MPAELILGIVGVVPLLHFSFKAYLHTYKQLKDYKHCREELQCISDLVDIQRHFFEEECKDLLGEALVQELQSEDYDRRRDAEIEATIQALLGSSLDICETIMRSISVRLNDLQAKLQEADMLMSQRPQGEKLRAFARRIRKQTYQKMRFVYSRSEYEQTCQALRQYNVELRELRKLVHSRDFQSPIQQSRMIRNKNSGNWVAAQRARQVACALHRGLQRAWSCRSVIHQGHGMRLFLEALDFSRNFSSVSRTSIAVVSQQIGTTAASIHLRVDPQVQQIASRAEAVPSADASPQTTQTSSVSDLSIPDATRLPESSIPMAALTASQRPAASDPDPRDLSRNPDVCGFLRKHCVCSTHLGQHCNCLAYTVPGCIGFLSNGDSEGVHYDFYRHIFYGQLQQNNEETLPISSFLARCSDAAIDALGRTRLAHVVATAALTYHDTPWLAGPLRLQDVCTLPLMEFDVENVIRSLHLEVSLGQRQGFGGDVPMARSDSAEPPTMRDQHLPFILSQTGRSPNVYQSLGVALVAIQMSKALDPDNPDHVRHAEEFNRYLIKGKYQAVVNECFSYTSLSSKPQDPQARFTSVIGKLEDMVAALSFDTGY